MGYSCPIFWFWNISFRYGKDRLLKVVIRSDSLSKEGRAVHAPSFDVRSLDILDFPYI